MKHIPVQCNLHFSQATTKKAKEEKAQGFGRKLDAEKIIGATNEPGLDMFKKWEICIGYNLLVITLP